MDEDGFAHGPNWLVIPLKSGFVTVGENSIDFEKVEAWGHVIFLLSAFDQDQRLSRS